ncbi:MAG: hypothetical protein IPM59_15080 [Chloracidobacterium sp.]|nr:hypothetical protein [Chloracidobacterium sp.]
MFPRVSLAAFFLTLVSLLFASGSTTAQSRKARDDRKKATAAKTAKNARDTKKERERARQSAKNARDNKDKKQNARDREREKRQKEKERLADAKSKKDVKGKPSRAEQRKAEAERRRKEAERRAAIEAERRRREQARREAIARAIAFEKGLRTETVANITKDVTEGEDLNIRSAAVTALGEHAGSVVVMEAQTGKVVTIINQDWAVRSGIKPCSTIKLVTGVAGLNEGVIDKESGALKTPSRLGLDDALAFSNNGYFQRAGVSFGNEKMIAYAKQLGLGEPTGINLEGEYAGKLPYGNSNPRIYSHGDDFEVTGVQLAVMVSAISNGGHRVLPRVPRNSIEKANFKTFYRDNVDVPTKSVRRVIPGMMGAAEYGTARRNMDQSLGVAGKTGSCISKGTWVGLFASVAPIEQPKYAVVVITRGRSERGRKAAAVAAQIYRALGNHIVRTNRNLAMTEFNIQPKRGLDPMTAKLGDEEDDTDGATDTNAVPGNVIVVPSVPRDTAPKKLVTRTVDSKPVFPPVVITYDKEKPQTSPQKP